MLGRRNGNGHNGKSLESLSDLYIIRCEVEGKSPNTLKAYAWALKRFTEIAREEGFPEDVRQITPAHVYSYLGRFSHLSLETRHRYHREISCFFNWLYTTGYVNKSPFTGIKKVRLHQKIVQPFSPDDVLKLLACCDPGNPSGARDRAILLVLLDTGVHVGELVRLQLPDLDLEGQRMRILHGKGNKQRVVAFGEDCKRAMVHYLGHSTPDMVRRYSSTYNSEKAARSSRTPGRRPREHID